MTTEELENSLNLTTPPSRTKRDKPTQPEVGISIFLGVFTIGWGLAYLLGGAVRFNSQVVTASAQYLMPWWLWGVTFILIGLNVMITIFRSYHWMALFLSVFLYAFFDILYIVSIITQENASYVPAWITFCLTAGFAAAALLRNKRAIERQWAGTIE